MDDRSKQADIIAPAILVAENELTARISLSELLRDEGYRVIEAADSGSALVQIRQNSNLRVILSSLEMPTWESIIAQGRHDMPSGLIVGMLRYGALANALEAQRLGADGYLVKPLSFGDVNDWIRRFLTGQSEIKR